MTPRDAFVGRVQAPCVTFLAATNPRVETCVKCGKGEGVHTPAAKPEVDPTRDLAAEVEFFTEVVQTAQRLTGISNPDYIAEVMHRLDIGRERYGDADYMRKDVLREVREETPDIAAYAVLELHKQRALGLDREHFSNLYQDLLAASAYAAVADYYAKRADIRLKETRG